jgi:capsular exopolysaccharide synthesis family protein
MPTKQLPIDFNVLRVIAYRYAWLLVVLTFVSFAFSSFIVASLINLYSASITIFVNPENLIERVVKGVAVTTDLSDQLDSLRQQVLSDNFIDPLVIQELGLRLEDVYVPPFHLNFMPKVLKLMEPLKNMIKRLFGLEIYEQSEEQKRYLYQQEMVGALKNSINIRQSRGMLLIISYTGLNPTTCRRVVEIIANQCKELLLRDKNQETNELLRYLRQQSEQVTQELEKLEKELADKKVTDFDKGPEARIALLQQRQQALDALRLITQDLETLAAKKREWIASKIKRETELRNDPKIMERLATISKDQEAMELELLKKQVENLRKIYTEEWPEVKTLKEEIAKREQSLQAKIGKDPEAEEKIFIVDSFYNECVRQIKQIEADEESLQDQEKKLNENIAIYETKIRSMPEIEKSFGEIQRKISLHEKRQLDLAEKLQTAEATKRLQDLRGENQIRFVNLSFPTKPSGPSPIILMGLLCLLGPAAGVGIIFLLYYLNNTVKSSEDVQKGYNLPVIAVIPRTNFKKALKRHRKLLKRLPKDSITQVEQPEQFALQKLDDSEVELFKRVVKRVVSPTISKELLMVTMLTNPESQAAEEYRRLCFNIEWGLKESLAGPCKTVMTASALPNEGKTITAVNLATTLARNHKVLLIDANFRKPAIHSIFGIPQMPGLSDMLANKITPELYVLKGSPNLSILTAGLTLAYPADLLSSKLMAQFIESVRSSSYFDYAIFDVPPVAQIPDSPIIASKLDGIVWVIWELRTSQEIVRLSLTRITNPAILGVVLNRSEQRPLPKKYNKSFKEYQQRGAMKPQQGRS